MKYLTFSPSDFFPVLFLGAETGISYQFQVGGTLCVQKVQEGAILPIGTFPGSESLNSELHEITHELVGLNESGAELLDQCLKKRLPGLVVKVDRNQLTASIDQWIHVEIWGCDDTLMKGFVFPMQCVLTW